LCYDYTYPEQRGGENRDEEISEQESSRKRGCLLECHETTGEAESWYGMPQMKGLKELKLLVSNETEAGRYGGFSSSS
jgi:hypothetical protein